MPAPATRFARLAPWPARGLLIILLLTVVAGLLGTRAGGPGPHLVAASHSDTALYRAIARDTAERGDTIAAYYAAAAAEQRARGYPLRPFVTMREPALALATARLGARPIALVFRVLALAALGLFAWRLRGAAHPVERTAATLLVTIGIVLLMPPVMAVWHESWAALLLLVALALAGGRGWPIACAAALAAMLVRELAAPAVAALAFVALAERRWREAAALAVAIGVLAAALALHARGVAAVTLPGDRASPGWARLGGWRFILAMVRDTGLLSLGPRWLVAWAVPLALLGWLSGGAGVRDRAALMLLALIVPFMAIGRPDNFYWGLLIAPLLPVGLAFAPRALADLVRAARQAAAPAPWRTAWTARASS